MLIAVTRLLISSWPRTMSGHMHIAILHSPQSDTAAHRDLTELSHLLPHNKHVMNAQVVLFFHKLA